MATQLYNHPQINNLVEEFKRPQEDKTLKIVDLQQIVAKSSFSKSPTVRQEVG